MNNKEVMITKQHQQQQNSKSNKITSTNYNSIISSLDRAFELFNNATIPIAGSVQFRYSWVLFTNVSVQASYNSDTANSTTCRAANGYSFTAGTTDGLGGFDFTQNHNSNSNPFCSFIGKTNTTTNCMSIKTNSLGS
ncbi:hypothetical protein ACTFIZ_000645 [Dictyostelium cf. discoideum]